MPKPPLRRGASNDFQTPPEALTPLLPYLNKRWTIWEPACGSGRLVRGLIDYGYPKVIGTDLYGQVDKLDFLTWEPGWTYRYIITNPPYSLKQQFLIRCYELGKPFALLLPLTTLETPKRQKLFRDHGVEIILFDKRINFQTPSGKGSGSWFATAWFTWGLNIGQQLTFTHLE